MGHPFLLPTSWVSDVNSKLFQAGTGADCSKVRRWQFRWTDLQQQQELCDVVASRDDEAEGANQPELNPTELFQLTALCLHIRIRLCFGARSCKHFARVRVDRSTPLPGGKNTIATGSVRGLIRHLIKAVHVKVEDRKAQQATSPS